MARSSAANFGLASAHFATFSRIKVRASRNEQNAPRFAPTMTTATPVHKPKIVPAPMVKALPGTSRTAISA